MLKVPDIFEGPRIFALHISIEREGGECVPPQIEAEQLPKELLAIMGKRPGFWFPKGVDNTPDCFLRWGHRSLSPHQGEVEEPGHTGFLAHCGVEVVRKVLAAQVGLKAVKNDILTEGSACECGVIEVQIIAGQTQDTVLENPIRELKVSPYLAIAGAGGEGIIEYLHVYGVMSPIVDGKGLCRASLSTVTTFIALDDTAVDCIKSSMGYKPSLFACPIPVVEGA